MKTVKEIKQYIDSKDWAEKFYKLDKLNDKKQNNDTSKSKRL